MSHANAEIARNFLAAWSAGAVDAASGMLSDDVEVHIPGRTPLAGVYRGGEEFAAYIDQLLGVTDGKTEALEIVDILANDERAAVITRARFERPGKSLECRRFFTFDLRDGLICELWIFDEDQYLVDGFYF